MLKILGLGNSFSWDATTYLDRIADDLYVRNLHIGGCSLEMHVDKIQNKKAITEVIAYVSIDLFFRPASREVFSA